MGVILACGHYVRVTAPLGWEENSEKSSLPRLSFPLCCVLSCGSESMSFPGSLLSYTAFCINPIFDCKGTKPLDMKSYYQWLLFEQFLKRITCKHLSKPTPTSLNHPACATTSPFLPLHLHFPSEFLMSSFYKP